MTQKNAVSQPRPSLLWLALLISMLLALWLQGPRLLDPYVVEEDFRSYYYMHRFQNPELFQDDVLIQQRNRIIELELGSLRLPVDSASPVYTLLFWLASHIISPVLFSKLLVFPLLGISVFYLYRIGNQLGDSRTAFSLALAFAALNLASPTSVSTIGGLQRSFIFPLLLPTVYYLLTGRDRAAAAVIFVSGLIYPPIFVLNAATYAVSLLSKPTNPNRWRSTVQWRRAIPLLAAVLSVALILLPILSVQLSRAALAAGPITGHMLTDPTFQTGGRRALFEVFPLIGRAGPFTSILTAAYVLILALLAVAIALLHQEKLRPIPNTLKHLFLAAWLSFTVAWLGIILLSSTVLYLPSRYVEAPLLLLLLIFISLHAGTALQRAAMLFQIHKKKMVWPIALVVGIVVFLLFGPEDVRLGGIIQELRWILLVLLAALALLYALSLSDKENNRISTKPQPISSRRTWPALYLPLLLAAFFFIHLFHAPFYHASPLERELLDYVKSLPHDVRLAGHPCLLDSVPLFSQRMALSSCEDPNLDSNVVLAMLQAYYAESGAEIIHFCQEHDIDYLVVSSFFLEKEFVTQDVIFFEPYNSLLLADLDPETEFALSSIPSHHKEFEQEAVFVIKCQPEVFN